MDNDSDLNVDDKKQISEEKCDQNDLPDNFEESQNLVAKLIHLIYNDDLRTHFKVCLLALRLWRRIFIDWIFSCLHRQEKYLEQLARKSLGIRFHRSYLQRYD